MFWGRGFFEELSEEGNTGNTEWLWLKNCPCVFFWRGTQRTQGTQLLRFKFWESFSRGEHGEHRGALIENLPWCLIFEGNTVNEIKILREFLSRGTRGTRGLKSLIRAIWNIKDVYSSRASNPGP